MLPSVPAALKPLWLPRELLEPLKPPERPLDPVKPLEPLDRLLEPLFDELMSEDESPMPPLCELLDEPLMPSP
jgi:hypothetical protein